MNKKSLILMLLTVGLFCLGGCTDTEEKIQPQKESTVSRNLQDIAKSYTDPTTGVEYWYRNNGYGAVLIVRRDTNGKPYINPAWKKLHKEQKHD